MTSDAIRQPGDTTRPTPEPDAPGASEIIPPGTEEQGTTLADGGASPAEESAAATADAVAPASDAVPAAESVAAAEALTSAESAAAEALTPAETVTTAEAVAATQAAAETPAATGPRRRERVVTLMRNLAVFVVAVALLVGGIALGVTIFQATRPPSTATPPGQLGTTTDQPALVTQEFISALRANDFDAMRSSLEPEAAVHFSDEIERRGVMTIDKVEVLGTHVAGQLSATEILLQYKSDEDLPRSINLVILVDGGKIEGFR